MNWSKNQKKTTPTPDSQAKSEELRFHKGGASPAETMGQAPESNPYSADCHSAGGDLRSYREMFL